VGRLRIRLAERRECRYYRSTPCFYRDVAERAVSLYPFVGPIQSALRAEPNGIIADQRCCLFFAHVFLGGGRALTIAAIAASFFKDLLSWNRT